MSEIRVNYSGFLIFVISIVTAISTSVVTIIITRTLVVEDFGLWTLISSLLIYSLVLDPIISIWTTRNISRKIEIGKTPLYSSSVFSIGGILVYLLAILLIGDPKDFTILILAGILIPPMYLLKVVNSINLGWKPESRAFSLFTVELIKIPVLITLYFGFGLTLEGVIISQFCGLVGGICIGLFYARKKLKSGFKIEYLKKWIKVSWITLYPFVNVMLQRTDVVIFSIITGSVVGLAYFGAGQVIAGLVVIAATFSGSIYAKLLGTKNKDNFKYDLTLQVFLIILFVSLIIAFFKQALFTLNPIYIDVYIIGIILAIKFAFYGLGSVLEVSLLGLEKIDLNSKVNHKEYMKSKLFSVPSIINIKFSVYLLSLVPFLIFANETYSILELIIGWSLLALISEIIGTSYFYIQVKKQLGKILDVKSIIKYIFVGILVIFVTDFLTEQFVVYDLDLINHIINWIPILIISTSIFLGLSYSIDKKIRNFVNAIIKEIIKILNNFFK